MKTTTRTVNRVPQPGEERIIRSQYETTCRLCGDAVHIGEQVWFKKGQGVRHYGICRRLEIERWKAEAEGHDLPTE